MILSRHGAHHYAIRLEHAQKFVFWCRCKQRADDIRAVIRQRHMKRTAGNILGVRISLRRVLCGRFGNIHADALLELSVFVQHSSHLPCVIAFAASGINKIDVCFVFGQIFHLLAHRHCQSFIISLIQKAAARFNHLFAVSGMISGLIGLQEIAIAGPCDIIAVPRFTAKRLVLSHQRCTTMRANQHSPPHPFFSISKHFIFVLYLVFIIPYRKYGFNCAVYLLQ